MVTRRTLGFGAAGSGGVRQAKPKARSQPKQRRRRTLSSPGRAGAHSGQNLPGIRARPSGQIPGGGRVAEHRHLVSDRKVGRSCFMGDHEFIRFKLSPAAS